MSSICHMPLGELALMASNLMYLLNAAVGEPSCLSQVVEHKDEYEVSLAAPGLKKEYFNVGVDGNMLTISSAAWLTKNNLLNSTLINKLT